MLWICYFSIWEKYEECYWNGEFVAEEQEIKLGPAVKKQVMRVEETSYSMKTIYKKAMDLLLFNLKEVWRMLLKMGTLFLRNKKLKLGPAVKKQMMPVEHWGLVVVSGNQMTGIILPCAHAQSCDNIHFHKAYIYNVDASTQIQIKVLLTYLLFLKEMLIIEPPISAA